MEYRMPEKEARSTAAVRTVTARPSEVSVKLLRGEGGGCGGG